MEPQGDGGSVEVHRLAPAARTLQPVVVDGDSRPYDEMLAISTMADPSAAEGLQGICLTLSPGGQIPVLCQPAGFSSADRKHRYERDAVLSRTGLWTPNDHTRRPPALSQGLEERVSGGLEPHVCLSREWGAFRFQTGLFVELRRRALLSELCQPLGGLRILLVSFSVMCIP